VSSDEILFDEVAYRQPRRARRPDRDPSLACLAYRTPGPDDLPIFLDWRTADRIERHALSDVSVELGGILLGFECVDEKTGAPFVWITQALEAKHFQNTQASFTYTHESWEAISRERDEAFPGLDIVGWYHTHPDFGIFLSGHDEFIHRHFFGQPLQVAFVIDPIRQHRGFFQWRDGALPKLDGYYLVAARDQRLALARTVNDLEGVPNAEAGGPTTLSPRLEAELIAMLHPPSAASTASARGASGLGALLLGLVLGVVFCGLALGLLAFDRRVQDQTAAIAALRDQLAETREVRADTLASERLRAKEEALDRLLSRVDFEAGPEAFLEEYQALQERLSEVEEEAAVYREIRSDLLRKNAEIRDLRNQLAQREAALERLSAARERIEELETENARLAEAAARLEELEASLDAAKAAEGRALLRKYDLAWYAAATGWGLAALLGLGLVAVVARLGPFRGVSDPEAPPTPPEGAPTSPHRID